MSRKHLTLACALLCALYALILFTRTAPSQAWPGAGTSVSATSDFVSLWTAGKLAGEGRPLAAYDWEQQKPEFEALTGKPIPESYYLAFPYPPTFLMLMALLALLSYGAAHLVWTILTAGSYAFAAWRITGSRDGLVWMLAPMPLIMNLDAGQTGALSATLLGLGLYFIPARPVLAGVLLGLLAYKPHLGLLIPFALAAAGHWRTFGAAAAAALTVALLSMAMFGAGAWIAFLDQMREMAAHIHGANNAWKLQSCYGLLRTLGASPDAALALHAVFCLALAALIIRLWRGRETDFNAKAAALAAASVMMSPYLFVYDLTVLMVAMAFLVRAGVGERPLVPMEVSAILGANLLIPLAMASGFPSAVFAPLILLALAVRRLLAPSAIPAGWALPRAG